MTALSAVVWLPRNTSKHKLTQVQKVAQHCNPRDWRKTPHLRRDETFLLILLHMKTLFFKMKPQAWGRVISNSAFNMRSSQMESGHYFPHPFHPGTTGMRENRAPGYLAESTSQYEKKRGHRAQKTFDNGRKWSGEQIRQPCQFPGGTDGEYSASCLPAAGPAERPRMTPRWNPIQHVDGTHLKHQPEEEHHSNTGNNICMVLDDKLMAQHRRVLVGLFSDPHLETTRPNFRLAQRGRDRSLSGYIFIILPCEDAQSSLLLPTSKGPGSNWTWRVTLLLVGGSTAREPLRLTNEILYVQERKRRRSLSPPGGVEYDSVLS